MRHVKCGEERPRCGACRKNQFTCDWPGPGRSELLFKIRKHRGNTSGKGRGATATVTPTHHPRPLTSVQLSAAIPPVTSRPHRETIAVMLRGVLWCPRGLKTVALTQGLTPTAAASSPSRSICAQCHHWSCTVCPVAIPFYYRTKTACSWTASRHQLSTTCTPHHPRQRSGARSGAYTKQRPRRAAW